MMRQLFLMPFLLFAAVACTQTRFEVDPQASGLVWRGSKVTESHYGNIDVKSGNITVENGMPVAAEVVVDMTSITCEDISNESSNKRLVDHLRSEDFFHVELHPEAVLRTTSITRSTAAGASASTLVVNGILEIKGVKHPTTLDIDLVPEGKGYRATGTLVFDRTKYDIKYRSGSFFEELGDKMIHDEVRLDLDIRTR